MNATSPSGVLDVTTEEVVETPAGTVPDVTTSAARRYLRWVLGLAGSLAVVAVHFRPWQGGLLEDWGMALAWRSEGMHGYVTRLPGLLGRPLHLLPHYVGLALSGGGFVGVYGVLAALALAQLLGTTWALRPLTSNWLVRWTLGIALALHPWWVAGDVLRYMPAQVSVTASVVWFGAAVRFLRGSSRWWLALVVLAPLFGLLTYQAPALALLGGAVALVVTTRGGRRGAVLFVVTGAVVGCVLLWSAVVAPALSPDSYESQLLTGNRSGPLHLIHQTVRTLVLHGTSVLVLAVVVVAALAAIGANRALSRRQVWSLLVVTAGSPLAALVYGSNQLQLNDPERLVLPVGLVLWLVLASLGDRLAGTVLLRRGLVVVVLVGTAIGSFAGYHRWTADAAEQQELLRATQAVRTRVPTGSTLVVADSSGRYGDVYLLLPPYLNTALTEQYGPGTDAELCTPAGVQRNHPVAALFPLQTTPDCTSLLAGPGVARLGGARTHLGLVDFYAVPAATG